jgi:hypothetical protein
MKAFVNTLLEADDLLYPPEANLDGTSKHSRHCKAMFARRDWQCRRCLELMKGAAPRGSWQAEYAARKLGQVQRSFAWPTLHALPGNPSTKG